MKPTAKLLIFASLISIPFLGFANSGQDRAEIAEKYKWNLKEIFETPEAWDAYKQQTKAKIKEFKQFEGKLSKSGKTLKQALDQFFQLGKATTKLINYAYMASDQDMRDPTTTARKQEALQIGNEFSKATAFIKPEILSIPNKKITRFFKKTPELKTYRHIVDDIQRTKDHTLNKEQEALVAETGLISGTAQDNYTILKNSDLPYPTIKLSNGEEIYLDSSGFTKGRVATNRKDRIKVFNAFFGALKKFEQSFGSQLYGEVKKNVFYKNIYNYESSLASTLDNNNIPTSVYHKLIENTNKNLDTFHRYLKIRKKLMGLDSLHYYDLYPPAIESVDLKYTYEEALGHTKSALAILGEEYINIIDRAINERWIDALPNTGKNSGAYVIGSTYDVHPYMLLNYNGLYEGMSTMVHEFGHVLHSYFSNKHQPYHLSRYPSFLAEVASTANEAILIKHMLKSINKKQERLALLVAHLDSFKGSMFRQTQFAEFELRIHEIVEKGGALTGKKLSDIYLEIIRKYYGHDKDICKIDERYAIEWAYIPHFYYNFYVYKYSTSYTAAQALAKKMLSGDPKMVEQYIDFLSSGGSDYAIPTLKKVGIDMTSDEPFNLAMENMNKVMDEIESILNNEQ